MSRKKIVGDGDSVSQKCTLGALPDAVRPTKKSSHLTRPVRRMQLTKTREP
jgi:hypothetical protein